MAFNWFNRFNKKEEEQQQPESAPVEPTPTAEPSESEAQSDTSEEDARIANARAIVENFRRKQQEKAQAEAATAEKSEPVEVSDSIEQAETEVIEQLAEDTIASAESETIEQFDEAPVAEAVQPEVEPVSEETEVEAVQPEVEPVSEEIEVEAVQPEVDVVEETEVEAVQPEAEPQPAAVPFWAQAAEADRQARLERLRANAIEEVEPEPQPVATQTAPEIPPEFVIDEGFLWSAEVLSAMGRRAEDVSIEEITWLKRLRQGLDKTRRSLVNQLKAIVGQGPLNEDAVFEIESLLLQADAGVEATDKIISALQAKLRQDALPPDQAIAYLKQILRDLLDQPLQGSHSAFFAPEKDTFNIWLMTGVNGAGKTTTIGKLAHIASKSGYKCLIGAADTFRAAAVEQVKVWGQRSNVEVISNPGQNTDPAAVVFDAISAAQARGTELLLIDTAGRLQNKKNLMDELSKVRRIIDKKAAGAKVESLLVLDATLGQNGLRQAEVFAQAAQLSGVVLTKLDGTAKGGIALAVVEQLGLPIRFIGAGEGIEDLRPFSSYEFVEALISG
ncbi:signal recognition particle-docking protein FtsY [Leptolyngbya sp. GGD]|uniref:signal recognition particle-docking protein FtsY n=1 Tax=Leptolyngbya sp. GGD TaxID=2997907 RepID=UPI00227D2593|nr:signal recognition particle-docking protein FtsY [Leptolyngbya sp. GGD]MCY6494488.1 signal recognition particle-docking protein FtsY [Leptolyngbya sp. GGD]